MRAPNSAINRSLRHGVSSSRGQSFRDWILIPLGISLALTLVFGISVQPFNLYLPEPVWPLVLAFAWPVIRPSYFAPVLLALHGLALDIFWHAPMGFYTLCLLIIYALALVGRTYLVGCSMMVIFLCYLAAVTLFFGLGMVLIVMDTGIVPNLIAVGMQAAATLCLYPLVAMLLERFIHADSRF